MVGTPHLDNADGTEGTRREGVAAGVEGPQAERAAVEPDGMGVVWAHTMGVEGDVAGQRVMGGQMDPECVGAVSDVEVARLEAEWLSAGMVEDEELESQWVELEREQAEREVLARTERARAAREGRLAAWRTQQAVVGELADMPAGPALAARVVEVIGQRDCPADMTVDLIVELGRSIAYLEGLRATLAWGLVEPRGGDTLEARSIMEEIAARIGHTYGTVGRMVELGMGMAASPDLGEAVRHGRIGAAKATQILRDTEHLEVVRRDHVISDVLSRHPETRNLPDLRTLTRTLAEWVDPRTAGEEHARATAKRAVWIDKARHGMAFLHAYLPAINAWQVYNTLTTMALAQDP
ncbi:MAG: 13E12 repeat family protein, partial [Bifidobacteriaceae bacterium]|nr:13E12 repeat family protein [Bifidobacteriaceae bacterium]